ncbi:hypothetical protein ABB37_01319 [Leptomonas pyrrhocoris]|uniref:Uncharacterized protein n=1 Tax=Leptomonas pyrrhocoris TaxID=157538 RepID=A0A0N0DZ46_LEPPY|nr:hypothetical protein ABB37_01319 [Leptomonas pyrrhocoris]KPA84851.1 hypothetical protein ABB37_01319 [Leptomonas pyrrhocoris]|eukprot:XP_015663290.1 hypothetical protein ABB37_01319 [Leptomonas pyrrhocoris]
MKHKRFLFSVLRRMKKVRRRWQMRTNTRVFFEYACDCAFYCFLSPLKYFDIAVAQPTLFLLFYKISIHGKKQKPTRSTNISTHVAPVVFLFFYI